MAKATKVRVSGEIQVNLRLSANAAGLKAKKESDALLFCGQRWIRTTEVERQQIYSLPHLATLEFAQTPFGSFANAKVRLFFE